MADEVTEMTFKQFVNSVWFRGLSRVGVLLLLPAAGYFLNTQIRNDARLTKFEQATEKRLLTEDIRNRAVDAALISTADDIASMNGNFVEVREDIASINGKLSVLINRIEPKSVVFLSEAEK